MELGCFTSAEALDHVVEVNVTFQDKQLSGKKQAHWAGAVLHEEEISITQTELSEPPSLAGATWEFPNDTLAKVTVNLFLFFPPQQIWNSWKTGNESRDKFEEYRASLMAVYS